MQRKYQTDDDIFACIVYSLHTQSQRSDKRFYSCMYIHKPKTYVKNCNKRTTKKEFKNYFVLLSSLLCTGMICKKKKKILSAIPVPIKKFKNEFYLFFVSKAFFHVKEFSRKIQTSESQKHDLPNNGLFVCTSLI